MAEVNRRLGKPLMPWQRYVADVALEVDPVTGRLAYSEVGLTVPRQSGKSTLILGKAVHRASATGFFGPRQRLVYTAQTRNKAREKWEEDYAALVQASKTWGPSVQTHLANGNEHMRFPNGSRFGIEAATEKAGHGPTLDEAYIDEAFAQVDNRLDQAFRPAMITRPNTQLWWVSTAGWVDGSPYLLDKVTRGREQVEMGVREGLAYFEWSAPDDAEIDDREVWRACMPALGHTISEDAISGELAAMTDDIAGFRRAYLNQWVRKEQLSDRDPVIDLAVWEALADDPKDPRAQVVDPVAPAIDMPPDRSTASIAIGGRRADGTGHVELIDHRRGSGWVVSRMLQLNERWRFPPVAIDASGPAGSLIPKLTEAGVEVLPVSAREMGQACGGFYDDVNEGTVRHIRSPLLNSALGAARKRSLGDAWAWARKNVTVDISPLVAVTLARFAFDLHLAKPARSGKVW